MKKFILSLAVLSSVALVSCGGEKKTTDSTESANVESAEVVDSAVADSNVAADTVAVESVK